MLVSGKQRVIGANAKVGFHAGTLPGITSEQGCSTADLRGNVNLSERGHAFADWLVRSGYKQPHFWCDYGSWGTLAKPFEKIEEF